MRAVLDSTTMMIAATLSLVAGICLALAAERLITGTRVGPRSHGMPTEYFDIFLGLPPYIDCDEIPMDAGVEGLLVDMGLFASNARYREYCNNVAARVGPYLQDGLEYDVWIALRGESRVGGWPFRSWQADETIVIEECNPATGAWGPIDVPIRVNGKHPRIIHLLIVNALIYATVVMLFIVGLRASLMHRTPRRGFEI